MRCRDCQQVVMAPYVLAELGQPLILQDLSEKVYRFTLPVPSAEAGESSSPELTTELLVGAIIQFS